VRAGNADSGATTVSFEDAIAAANLLRGPCLGTARQRRLGRPVAAIALLAAASVVPAR